MLDKEKFLVSMQQYKNYPVEAFTPSLALRKAMIELELEATEQADVTRNLNGEAEETYRFINVKLAGDMRYLMRDSMTTL